MTPGWIGAEKSVSAYGESAKFICRGYNGVTGVLKFSDNSSLTIKGGIITNVTAGDGATFD